MPVAVTSHMAARSIKPSAKTLRSQVFHFLLGRSVQGATLEEIATATGIKLQTVCARRNELGKKRLVVDSGRRRATSSGRSAIVWVVPARIRERADARGMTGGKWND